MRSLAWAALVAMVWLSCMRGAIAQPPDSAIRVASLIRLLGSESYAARVQAHSELAKLGTLSREQLVAALNDPEAEIRLRARELLKQLKVEELWNASRVAIDSTDAKAGEALQLIATQTSNRIVLGDQYGNFREQTVALSTGLHPFWLLMDEICSQSGNRFRAHYDTRQPGLVAVAGARTKFPVAYSGPLRSTITAARRAFNEELDYEGLDSDVTHTFQLGLQMMWEERFQLVAYRTQPELVQARTDAGIDLSAPQAPSSTWSIAGGGARQVSMNIRLQPPAVTVRKLESLKLRWGLIAIGDMATIETSELDSAKPLFQDDVQLSIESCQAFDGGRCEVTLGVLRDAIITEPQDLFFHENEVTLFDKQGRPFRQQGQSHSLTETGAKLKITFVGEANDSAPAKLAFRYPRIRSHRSLDLEFRDVPLPVAKPE